MARPIPFDPPVTTAFAPSSPRSIGPPRRRETTRPAILTLASTLVGHRLDHRERSSRRSTVETEAGGGGTGAIDYDVVHEVGKAAHVEEFVYDLPERYDTVVGERGLNLSGGQRQRVAIAQAMAKRAPILVLDEATSALDSESEHLVQEALWQLMERSTALVIAHRLSTIAHMDRIVVFDQGTIVEEGTHRQLLARGDLGLYGRLWHHQSGGFLVE
jgi:hypothetical protein